MVWIWNTRILGIINDCLYVVSIDLCATVMRTSWVLQKLDHKSLCKVNSQTRSETQQNLILCIF